jgi:hypothetical protein
MSTREYFWTPRGDAHVVGNDAGRVTLDIALPTYGMDAYSWDIDHYNALDFFCLQCVVGFWGDAKYSVAVRSMDVTPALIAAVEGHARSVELDELERLTHVRDPVEDDWLAFAAAAERLIADVEIDRRGPVRRTLRFRVTDPAHASHIGPLRDWCLG